MHFWMPLALAAALTLASPVNGAPVREPQIVTSDVANFYKVFDAAAGRPGPAALQAGYIAIGSPGLKDFIPNRIISADALSRRIAEKPQVYAQARACMAVLPRVRPRVRAAMRRLAELYPPATFPPITVLVGRDNSGGTTGPGGVIIGLEVVCSADHLQPKLDDRFVHIIAHEYVHVEQNPPDGPTPLLYMALVEGTAEFIAELTSGEASESYIGAWAKGREREIGQAFLKDMDKTGPAGWMYNGVGSREKPGDLGYWIGYRIARSYYLHARDKKAAIRTLIEMKDPHAVLRDSGWQPGL